MNIAFLPVTLFQQNCMFIWDGDSGKGVVIDPGGDVDHILKTIEEKKIKVERILITHGHIDHIGGAAALRDALGVQVEGPHEADSMLMDRVAEQARMFGVPSVAPCEPDVWFNDGDLVSIAGQDFEVLHCPGHSPGHVAYANREARLVIVGDVLFKGSVGRTDLPGGDPAVLIASIRDKLFPLGDDVHVLPGHGAPTTIGEEKRNNPFLTEL